jgi:hypothetical protein
VRELAYDIEAAKIKKNKWENILELVRAKHMKND